MRGFLFFMPVFIFCACGIAQAQENLLNTSDSLTQLIHIDSLIADSLNRKIDAIASKLDVLQDSLNKKIQVPDSLKRFVPKEANLLENQGLPKIGTKEMDKGRAFTEIEELEKIQHMAETKELGDLSEASSLKEVEEFKELEKLSKQAKELNEASSKEEYIAETAEEGVKETKAFQELEEQKGVLDKQMEATEHLGDEDYFKEKVVTAVKDKAKDHFAGHTDKLQAAQEKLAKIKKEYPEGISSIKDLPKRRPNPMRSKSFKERLVLGLTLQIHQAQTPNVDISPFAAYKLTERLSLGLGGNYRLMTKHDFKGFTREGAVYGGRGFAEFKIYKGIFAHVEYEMMKSPQRDSLVYLRLEQEEKIWVDGLLLGIGKDYKIAKYIKGNMQVLYNFLPEINSPYQNRVMVRFGFNFQLKDKIKKPKVEMPDKEEIMNQANQKIKNSYKKGRGLP